MGEPEDPTGESIAPTNLLPLVKASFIGPTDDEHPGSQQIATTPEDQLQLFTKASALSYPLGDPAYILFLYEHSSALRQNIDAYCTNIDGFGQRLEPVLDLEAENADQRIADALWMRRAHEADRDDLPLPTPAEVAAEKKRLGLAMRLERLRVDRFLEFACLEHSLVTLRRRTRQDLELLGNAYWEVQRDPLGNIVELTYTPAFSIRPLPLDKDPVDIEVTVKISDIDYGTVRTRHKFRKLIQVVSGQAVYFKEFGDPRIVSRLYGAVFPSVEALKANNPLDSPAAELVHFKIHSPQSPYGVPRWAGTLLTTVGLRESEEVNRDYWENKTVPPLAIAVSGGRFSDDAAKRIEDHLKNRIKGKKNFHKVLILEAAPAFSAEGGDGGGARCRIQFYPLTDAQLKDATHQQYDVRCMDKVGFAFRNPRPLRGDMQDINRAAYESALVFAEMQVYQPERQEFDDWVNRHLFTALGFRYWRFVSNGPIPRDSGAVAELVSKMAQAGVLTVNEARALSGDVFNRVLPKLKAEWANMPVALLLRSPVPPGTESDTEKKPEKLGEQEAEKPKVAEETEGETPALEKEARHLIAVRAALLKLEQERAAAAFAESQHPA
jgi:PBSX family phage portal protein